MHEALKAKLSRLGKRPPLAHRLHRCLSWLERSNSENDTDAKYIFLWIAFNAAYAVDRRVEREMSENVREYQRHKKYFHRLDGLDRKQLIYNGIRCNLPKPIRSLMNNEYVFQGFWDSLGEQPFDWKNWTKKEQFESDRMEVERRLGLGHQYEPMEAAFRRAGAGRSEDVVKVLVKVFDRLYVLRNQIMHGCATMDGSLNRRQVEDGAKILSFLVPVFLDIMMDNPEEDWGRISYPVRDDIREDRR